MFTLSHDYYAILGVAKNATVGEIKAQYKKLMKEHHPDQFSGLRKKYEAAGDADLLEVIDEKIARAEEFCKFLNEAFEVLSDPTKRKQYDEQVYEPTVQGPEIVVSPKTISFGTLTEGQKKSAVFSIENKGGPASSVDINWEGKPDWGDLIIEPDPDTTFPIKVTTVADTAGIPSGTKEEKILVTVDGQTQMVDVFMTVRVAARASSFVDPHSTHAPSPAPKRTGILVMGAGTIVALFCVVSFLAVAGYLAAMVKARENYRQQLVESLPVEITEARRIRLGDEIEGEERKIVENRGWLAYISIVFTVKNGSSDDIRVEPVEGTPMHGEFYSVWVDPGASFPCGDGHQGYIDPGEEESYLCFEQEGTRLEKLCLDIRFVDPEKPYGERLTKTVCSPVVDMVR